jgi:hypothetical protein
MWRSPSAEEVGPRLDTLSSADGGPPVIGRRVYRTSPTGRRYNSQQTVGLEARIFMDRMAKWPTPQVSDASGTISESAARLDHRPGNSERDQLHRRVASLYTNEDSPFWPTPRTGQGQTYRKHATDGRQGLTLEGRAARWPTPRAIYGEHRGMVDKGHLTGQAIELWATPIGRDWKDSAMDPSAKTPTNSILGRQVLRTGLPYGLPAPESGNSGSGSSNDGPTSPRPPSRARLNYRFASWLMGYDPEWSNPYIRLRPTRYEPSATPSCLPKRRSLSVSSTDGRWG